MTDGEFPFKSFTMRSEGYDRDEVDTYVGEMQREITEQRRALDAATPSNDGDARLHDPEGAVTRTLAIAQETADRVLHDAQVEADRRRTEADEHATRVMAEADERAARLLGDMEAQAAEVREQGVAAARSAIQVERDKAMGELAHIRRVRDDLRNEAVELKSALDRYRSQAREASDSLAATASGPLLSADLPDFIDDDVVLAGITPVAGADLYDDEPDFDDAIDDAAPVDAELEDVGYLRSVDDEAVEANEIEDADDADGDDGDPDFADGDLADVISIDADHDGGYELADADLVDEIVGGDEGDLADIDDADDSSFGGTFLAEVRAAAEDDDLALAPENDDSDRFLSELRGIAGEADDDLDSDAADRFFNDES